MSQTHAPRAEGVAHSKGERFPRVAASHEVALGQVRDSGVL
jgi:hypothetical protein